MNANQILNNFISQLQQYGNAKGFSVDIWKGTRRKSRNIIEIVGTINCLIYIKVRSEEPYRWGVTKNRIEELNKSGKKWCLVLLYESPNSGYFLTADEVNRYRGIWPLGIDGDYKVAIGTYLKYNIPFNSFSDFINSLVEYCKGG